MHPPDLRTTKCMCPQDFHVLHAGIGIQTHVATSQPQTLPSLVNMSGERHQGVTCGPRSLCVLTHDIAPGRTTHVAFPCKACWEMWAADGAINGLCPKPSELRSPDCSRAPNQRLASMNSVLILETSRRSMGISGHRCTNCNGRSQVDVKLPRKVSA